MANNHMQNQKIIIKKSKLKMTYIFKIHEYIIILNYIQ